MLAYLRRARDADENADVLIPPATFELLPVVNRGKQYPVPTKHRGRAVDLKDHLEMAAAGIAFHDEFLTAAEVFFVK